MVVINAITFFPVLYFFITIIFGPTAQIGLRLHHCWWFTLRLLMSYIYMEPAAAHLLRSWVRIPPGAWIFVCCECRALSRGGLCDELITRPEESYRLWCVVVCDLETSRMSRPWPALGRSATAKKRTKKMCIWKVGRDSSVGIAIRYVLDVRELNPGGRRDFSLSPRPTPGPNQPAIEWVPDHYRG